jgi:hypothetical protein
LDSELGGHVSTPADQVTVHAVTYSRRSTLKYKCIVKSPYERIVTLGCQINVIFWTKDSTMQFLCPKINKNLKEKKRKECVLFY